MKTLGWIILWICFWPILLPVYLIRLMLKPKAKSRPARAAAPAAAKKPEPRIRMDVSIERTPPAPRPQPAAPKKAEAPAPEPRCPHCGFLIDPPPQRARKCPNCKEQLYVRTDRESGHKILLDEAGKDRVDKERAAIAEQNFVLTQIARTGISEEEFARRKKARPELSDRDILWGALNEKASAAAQNRQWGNYRGVRLSMTELLLREDRYEGVLQMASEVFILDINGPNNMSDIAKEARTYYKEFPRYTNDFYMEPGHDFPAPAIVNWIRESIEELELNMDEARKRFAEQAESLHQALRLPADVGHMMWWFEETIINGRDTFEVSKESEKRHKPRGVSFG